jgi:hypothetical protein
VSYLQIYREGLQDLVRPQRRALRVRGDGSARVYVEGLSEHAVASAEDALKILARGSRNRVVAATAANDVSSRSHALIFVRVSQRRGDVSFEGRLTIVDLAGSERQPRDPATAAASAAVAAAAAAAAVPRTPRGRGSAPSPGGASAPRTPGRISTAGHSPASAAGGAGPIVALATPSPTRNRHRSASPAAASAGRVDESEVLFREATSVNLSLTSLGKVMSALISTQPGTHVPFRDSKLTHVLSDSIGGASNTCIIITVGPHIAHYAETLNSLLFGQRARRVRADPRPNILSLGGEGSASASSSSRSVCLLGSMCFPSLFLFDFCFWLPGCCFFFVRVGLTSVFFLLNKMY